MAEKQGLISQILPRSLAGVALWLLLFGAGVAAAGVVLFFYYNYRLELTKEEILAESRGFDEKVREERREFEKLFSDARAEIEKAAGGLTSRKDELVKLLEEVGPSIALIQGKDLEGNPTSGSGFIVASRDQDSWILTNFHPVGGSIAEGSAVQVRIGENVRASSVFSWDQPADLALVIFRSGGLPALSEWEREEPELGTRVWAVGSSPGRFGAAASQGFLLDAAGTVLLTDADVPTSASGGPLLDGSGKVLGVLSLYYAPEGYAPSNGWAVPIEMACRRVLRCP